MVTESFCFRNMSGALATLREVSSATPEDRLREVTGRLMRGWMRISREQARRSALSLPQLFLLRALNEMQEIPATRWAEMVGVSPSAATGLLDGLEAAAYIRRTHDTRDRRQVLVSLTPKGRRFSEQVRANQRKEWHRICSTLSKAELGTAAAVLAKLAERLECPQDPADGPLAGRRRASR
jgi:DNA-binding MarR family transcriptional regulator